MNILYVITILIFNTLKEISTFEVTLIPTQIHNDTSLNQITEILQNIPFNLPTMTICFGTPNNQCLNLAFSTGNSFSIIENHSSIFKHFDHQFNPETSSSFNSTIRTHEIGIFVLGLHYYLENGLASEDYIKIPNQSIQSTKPFRFMVIKSDNILPCIHFDGFLGLQRVYMEEFPFMEKEMSFIHHLYNSSVITRRNFAFEFNNEGGGKAIFGEDYSNYSKCYCSKPSFIRKQWDCKVNTVTIGNQIIFSVLSVEFDSLKSFIIAPEKKGGKIIFNYIINYYQNDCFIKRATKYTLLVCNKETKIDEFPDIRLKLEEASLVIQWKNIFRIGLIDGEMMYLSFLLVSNKKTNEDDGWIIGLPGFIDNSIVFDYDNNSVGIKHISPLTKYPNKVIICFIINMPIMILGIVIILLTKSHAW